MRKVTGGRVVAAICVSVALVGAPVASAVQSVPSVQSGPAVPTASVGHTVHAQESNTDEPPWGLLGLVGLLGLAGLVRRRRKPVVADPLAAYPVMREAARRDPAPSPRGATAVRVAQRLGRPATTTGRSDESAVTTNNTSAARPARPRASTPPAIPAQNRGGHEQVPYTPRPKPAQPTAYLPAVSSSPTSVTRDGSIRLSPAPPLHAGRLSRANRDVPEPPRAPGDASAEPQWPRRDYD